MKKLETRQMTLIGLMSALMCVAGSAFCSVAVYTGSNISDKSDHLSDSICTRVQIRYCELCDLSAAWHSGTSCFFGIYGRPVQTCRSYGRIFDRIHIDGCSLRVCSGSLRRKKDHTICRNGDWNAGSISVRNRLALFTDEPYTAPGPHGRSHPIFAGGPGENDTGCGDRKQHTAYGEANGVGVFALMKRHENNFFMPFC